MYISFHPTRERIKAVMPITYNAVVFKDFFASGNMAARITATIAGLIP
jgi:hypothetical protein